MLREIKCMKTQALGYKSWQMKECWAKKVEKLSVKDLVGMEDQPTVTITIETCDKIKLLHLTKSGIT